MTEYPKKLIEVALPLDDINKASAYEKLPGIGAHPRGIHHWWARRPFGAARAIIFSQLVNDPGGKRGYGKYKGQTKEDAQRERERLFEIVRKLADWKESENQEILEQAKEEIKKSWQETCEITGEAPEKMPPFLDPFAGGGALPFEAQRLGLEAHASDLNPVAVMINKAMIEIPPKFSGKKPVGPAIDGPKQKKTHKEDWSGAKGLAEDVRRYGHWIQDEAIKRIGHLYPEVELPGQQGRGKATIIAWLWARTVKCPNPACGAMMPLVRSFDLSTKKGKRAWVEYHVNRNTQPPEVSFTVHTGNGKGAKGTVDRKGAVCLCCSTPVPFPHIRSEGQAGRMKEQLMAVVAEGKKERIYITPSADMEALAAQAEPQDVPNSMLPDKALGFRIQQYGMVKHRHLFTLRQLTALSTLSDLVQNVRDKVIEDAKHAGWVDDRKRLNEGGEGATAYGDAMSVYLAFAVDRCTDFNNSLTGWRPGNEKIMGLFNRQAIPMVWDFGEANILANVVGGFITNINYQAKCIEKISASGDAFSRQDDAISSSLQDCIISTDPPYYDNIGYADLSDFFYVWLRRSLKTIYPDIFSTMLVPKTPELVATPYRHGTKDKAESFFMDGMTRAIRNMMLNSHPAFPVTIYYAFKQSETKAKGTASTGWETFLEAIKTAGFSITGTWPMRSEQSTRMVGMGTNALASSIVLVCRKRPADSETISRKQFLRELDDTLPNSMEEMIGGSEGASPIAPVDLAQAAIGPGMAIFSKYEAVLEADGSPMSVHNALILINKAIDEYFSQAESDMDSDTRFCVEWFLQYGFATGLFGEADVLARAKGTTVDGVEQAGVIESGSGKVRLLHLNEYNPDWDPAIDKRVPVWEGCHQLCRALQTSETEAGRLLARMPEKGESIRQLAYRLYTQCERKGWADDARNYNGLITSWHAILEESRKAGEKGKQMDLFDLG